MRIPDENSAVIGGVRYTLVKDRHHEVGDGFALFIDRPNKAIESSFIPLEVVKALQYLLKCKEQ